jgi:hypothetical protein
MVSKTIVVMSSKLLLQHKEQDQTEKEEKTIALLPEIDQEIECPRCYDIMVLSSDFNKLSYFYEECNLSLRIN